MFLGRTALGPSEADFKLGCILAFYCNGDLDQMRRLFLQSGLVREKTTSARKGAPGDYLGLTLWNALRIYRIKHGEKHWIAAPRKPKAPRGGTDGRPLSGATQKIVNLHTEQPELTFRAISVALSIPLETVRKAIQRHGNTPASSPPNVRTVRSCVGLPPEEEQPAVEDARADVLSPPVPRELCQAQRLG